jgi:hypothetical protein
LQFSWGWHCTSIKKTAVNAGIHNFFYVRFFQAWILRYFYVIYHNDDEKYLNLEKSRIQFFYNVILLKVSRSRNKIVEPELLPKKN